MHFASKKDSLFFFVIWGTVLLIALSNVMASAGIVANFIGFAIIAYLIWMWFGTKYTIGDSTLTIQSGGFKRKINISEIKKIGKVKHPLSAPALSMDRLEISYGLYKVITISPKNESEFIKLIAHENPQIKVDEKLAKKVD